MTYLFALSALFLLLLIYMFFEARFVQVKHVKFTKNSRCLKIIHISDIHINRLRVQTWRVKDRILNVNPDLIIITGDYIETVTHVDKFLGFLKEIKCHYKVYLCLGNHDYKAFSNNAEGLSDFIESIKCLGITILHNECICYEKNSKKYNIAGIEDLREGSPDIDKALAGCCADAFMNIAFSHNPDLVLEIPPNKVDYLFCGHFHGGQIWTPFGLEFKILRKDRLCKMGIKRGLHRINNLNLYINKGLGNVAIPLRFLSRPEITVYYLP